MSDSRSLLRDWWRDRTDYQGLVETLTGSAALPLVRFTVGLGGVVMCAITILTMLSPAGPSGTVARWVFVAIAVLAAGWTIRWWLLPWPCEVESLAWVAAADVAITTAGLLDSDRVYGAVGGILLVVTGAYLSLFHSPKALAVHTVWSLASIVALSGRIALGSAIGDTTLAAAIVLTMVAATVLVLPTLQFCTWLMRVDTLTDPLTGLLNRRGLDYYLPGFVRSARSGEICVLTVDLDRFKAVNDTYGHGVGDEALVRTAAELGAVAGEFLIARTGGEEFALIGRLSPATCGDAAEAVRRAIESIDDLPVRLTASVGAALLNSAHLGRCGREYLLTSLLRSSDAAMYQAKHKGGNTVVFAARVTPQPI
ncbi:diguanylate cyclase [Nocardia sp. NPDC059240]|uniref:GGDEF domain-containing protein n=1 Tax=Nocardia sp. NPDC059240 TaxID=3346786 RepID=UPI0036D0481A